MIEIEEPLLGRQISVASKKDLQLLKDGDFTPARTANGKEREGFFVKKDAITEGNRHPVVYHVPRGRR